MAIVTVSGPITEYWVERPAANLTDGAGDAFLRRFYGQSLAGARRASAQAIRAGLLQDRGTMENSLGVHPLERQLDSVRRSSPKPAQPSTRAYRVSWLVGLLGAANREYVFASAAWRQNGAVDTLEGAHLAVRTFIRTGLIPDR